MQPSLRVRIVANVFELVIQNLLNFACTKISAINLI